MRILHVFHHYRPCVGGIEKVILELNKNMKAMGHECGVLCLNKCPKNRKLLAAEEKFDEAKVERLGFLDFGFYKLAPFSMKRLKGFDVVHVHGLGFFADYLGLAKVFGLHKKPLVLSTHGGIFHTKKISLLKKIYFKAWARLILRAFSCVVAVSKSDKETFSAIVNLDGLRLVENGVEWKRFSKISGKRERNSLLYVGRFSRNKGIEELLATLALVKKKEKNFLLRVVGTEFDLRAKDIGEMTKKLGIVENVQIVGQVSDEELVKLYAVSEVFVSASRYEGFGISAVEAMAAGLIPVLNDIPPFQRFAENEENGFIADFSNNEKAAEKIIEAIGTSPSKKKKISDNARDFASRFAWEKKAREYEAVYRECLE